MIEKRLKEIRGKLTIEAALVERMVENSVNALIEDDASLIEEVLRSEKELNRSEVETDELCVTTLALYHPEASYLRKIVAALKNNNDFERMGDQAVNITESAAVLLASGADTDLTLLKDMLSATLEMLRKAIRSFVDDDCVSARELPAMDDRVDGLEKAVIQQSIAEMTENSSRRGSVETGYHMIRIAQNLERIADLSTNIAQETIFMGEGLITKHGESESLGS